MQITPHLNIIQKIWREIKRAFKKNAFVNWLTGSGDYLTKLANKCGTDKGDNLYTLHYATHFGKWRFKKVRLLEIGVGGYDDPAQGGCSLRMWKKYFPFGKIFGVDICDKSQHQESRIKIFQGSQVDKQFLKSIEGEIGELDIIVDDGSHLNEHVPETFRIMFPKLKSGGIYVIEDVGTSYLEEFGGDSKDLNNPKTTMNFLKSLTDHLNRRFHWNPNFEKTYYSGKIASIYFYNSVVFICKK
jgi:demethylmacrocin O-methyltransferase